MDGSMFDTTFCKDQVKLAEEQYQRGNVIGAMQIVSALTFGFPNSSANHYKISQTLVAYEIHLRVLQDDFTQYDILDISDPFCSYMDIHRSYYDLVDKLCPDRNKSVAAKSAFEIINTAWKVLSDPGRRRAYNSKQGFTRRIIYHEIGPHQSIRQENRHYIQIDSDSDDDFNSGSG
ncbi:unnamed protein product [Thlaspi arvense]|uniref:J domain-containing protein n=1 Tax=Thlaspi arvense TaxID=13288 RepID=A0AAU9RCL5_THLAR|nr:unnamed protein product [Thlaspi arvense]